MLKDHRSDGRVGQQPLELCPRPVQTRPDLRDGYGRRDALRGGPPRQAPDLPLQILTQLMRLTSR